MATVSTVTGKSATFTYKTVSGSAQITEYDWEQSSSAESVETLTGTAVTSSKKERTVTCSFLFDGNTTGGGFYKALQEAYEDGLPGALAATIGTASFASTAAVVTALSGAVPADGQVTCEATFTVDSWTPTYPTAP